MRPASHETWEQYRRRMLAETGAWITWALHHPDEMIDLPIKRVGEGGFPAKVGEWFWGVVLAGGEDSRTRRWLGILTGRRRRSKLSWRR